MYNINSLLKDIVRGRQLMNTLLLLGLRFNTIYAWPSINAHSNYVPLLASPNEERFIKGQHMWHPKVLITQGKERDQMIHMLKTNKQL